MLGCGFLLLEGAVHTSRELRVGLLVASSVRMERGRIALLVVVKTCRI